MKHSSSSAQERIVLIKSNHVRKSWKVKLRGSKCVGGRELVVDYLFLITREKNYVFTNISWLEWFVASSHSIRFRVSRIKKIYVEIVLSLKWVDRTQICIDHSRMDFWRLRGLDPKKETRPFSFASFFSCNHDHHLHVEEELRLMPTSHLFCRIPSRYRK